MSSVDWEGHLPLRTDPSFAFAHDTISNRIPSIADKVVKTNKGIIPDDLLSNVHELGQSIAKNLPVHEPFPGETDEWKEVYENQFKGRTWHDIPWFAAEAYFYRLILQFVEFQSLKIDPFRPQKNAELNSDHVWELVKTAVSVINSSESDALGKLLITLPFALWGNRSDLCYVKVASKGSSRAFQVEEEHSNVLVDNRQDVVDFLGNLGLPVNEIAIICDNSGAELVLDLVLVDVILSSGIASNVTLHVKENPTFVSDATVIDVEDSISAFACKKDENDVSSVGIRLGKALENGSLKVTPHEFWNSWKFFHMMPVEVKEQLSRAVLVISKGDANYRRVIVDHLWPVDTAFASIAAFFPCSLLCLRTLKSVSV
eukprot:TRINITY_DN7893_c0_g1_i2.p1 TRINITY_DN7893_c0_g1~~TRINITY_DN7893_c0_g1_i2.p1  ORF type:complete len:372 (+),score=99.27 TRINITY_DN7893_c0_g1_i2:135-1250(+)